MRHNCQKPGNITGSHLLYDEPATITRWKSSQPQQESVYSQHYQRRLASPLSGVSWTSGSAIGLSIRASRRIQKTKGAWQKDACTNSVTKIYGSKVIREDFKTAGFTGGSWSSYDQASKKWRQTWVDDTGAYLFEGGMVAGELRPDPNKRGKGTCPHADSPT